VSVNGVPLLRSVRLDRDRVDDPSAFPFTLPAIRALEDGIDLSAPVTLLVGENGSGKSTIVEALADKLDLDAEGGDTNLTFVSQRADAPLADALVLSRGPRRPSMRFFLRAESFFNVARDVDATDPTEGKLAAYGGRPLHGMSHGESFLTLAVERFLPDGLFLLDEPEAALSPQGCLSFLRRMHELVLDGAQFVVATHSPFLLLYPGAAVYALDDDGISRVDGAESDHVRLTRLFLEAPERFLRELFG
jgi:predicted ATPase